MRGSMGNLTPPSKMAIKGKKTTLEPERHWRVMSPS